MNLDYTETPEPGGQYIPVDTSGPGRRFIPMLHVPNKAQWHGTLAALVYLSQRNSDRQVIAQEVIDALMEDGTKQRQQAAKKKGGKRGRA